MVGLRLWGQWGPRPAALARSEVSGLALPPLPPEPARGPGQPPAQQSFIAGEEAARPRGTARLAVPQGQQLSGMGMTRWLGPSGPWRSPALVSLSLASGSCLLGYSWD